MVERGAGTIRSRCGMSLFTSAGTRASKRYMGRVCMRYGAELLKGTSVPGSRCASHSWTRKRMV